MTITELIESLISMRSKYGDLKVNVDFAYGYNFICGYPPHDIIPLEIWKYSRE